MTTTQTQSLADILNEIEERNKPRVMSLGHGIIRETHPVTNDVPKLVKALRLLRLNYGCLDHHDWRKEKIDSELAAIPKPFCFIFLVSNTEE